MIWYLEGGGWILDIGEGTTRRRWWHEVGPQQKRNKLHRHERVDLWEKSVGLTSVSWLPWWVTYKASNHNKLNKTSHHHLHYSINIYLYLFIFVSHRTLLLFKIWSCSLCPFSGINSVVWQLEMLVYWIWITKKDDLLFFI